MMQNFLQTTAEKFGFFYGIQLIPEVDTSVDEKGDGYVSSVLTGIEFDIFKQFKFRKRRVEWFSGRCATKQAFNRYLAGIGLTDQISKISVLNDPARAPYILNYPNLLVSISHSNDYAVSVIAPFKIGIDIEKIAPRPDALTHYFCSSQEASILRRDQQEKDKWMTYFWSRKEAVSKFLHLGGQLNFKQISTENEKLRISEHEIQLISDIYEEYWISIAVAAK